VFVFNAALGAGNVDEITDFNVADDTIYLENAVFEGLRGRTLSSYAFAIGEEAHDHNDRIIYDEDTGALYYDADGSGHRDQVQFATLDANLNLTYKDLYVV
jgi:Ca2+-binding RTX toxin-like protein